MINKFIKTGNSKVQKGTKNILNIVIENIDGGSETFASLLSCATNVSLNPEAIIGVIKLIKKTNINTIQKAIASLFMGIKPLATN